MRRLLLFGVLAVSVSLVGCERSKGGSTTQPAVHPADAQAGMAAIAAIPLGDVVGGQVVPAAPIGNPFDGSPEAVAQGRSLFVHMNCAGCHGYTAKGGMGPNLTDGYWRYGGAPVQVFKSIYEGRPQGMPAWNPALPPDTIWKVVAYIQSLGGTYPAGARAAYVQGDTPDTGYAPETHRVLPQGAQQPAEAKPSGQGASAQPRPDAGGKP